MSCLPTRFASVIVCFQPLFRPRTWRHAQALRLGAILAPGRHTVASVLRLLGGARERRFVNYHRVLNRAVWSPRAGARVLLSLVVRTFVPEGPVVLGIDETLERRRGARIAAKGIYYDAVRSSRAHFVKASGLRWLSVMVLAPVSGAQRIWALPVLSALAPSERYQRERRGRHKRLTDWARQLLLQIRRWFPGRTLIVVADAGFAALELLAALAPHMTCITRLRLDAALFAPAPSRTKEGAVGRPRKKGARLPKLSEVLSDPHTRWHRLRVLQWDGAPKRSLEIASDTAVWYHPGAPVVPIRWVLLRDPQGRFEPQALLCTDLSLAPAQIVAYFVRRWQMEVTFEETRRHLGVETQRQWSERAIARTTPVLLALFSIVTVLANRLVHHHHLPLRQSAWYRKAHPTFSDALAAVRRHLWYKMNLSPSRRQPDIIKIPRGMFRRLQEAVCYAA